jgi:hypothetical protein
MIKLESSEVVTRLRPLGRNAPQDTVDVCPDSTVIVLPEGTDIC